MLPSASFSPAEPDVGADRRRTFVVADLAGLAAPDEAGAGPHASELAELLPRLVRRHGGEHVRTVGVTAIARAERARDAVELGLATMEELAPQAGPAVVRVGMHTASAFERRMRWPGNGMLLAAHAAAAAAGGEVLLTEVTHDEAGEIAGVAVERRGGLRHRGVGKPVALFRAIRLGDTRGRLVIDPVCRMVVPPGESAGELDHRGVRYRFCSLRCAEAFASAPEGYARRGHETSAARA